MFVFLRKKVGFRQTTAFALLKMDSLSYKSAFFLKKNTELKARKQETWQKKLRAESLNWGTKG